MGMKKLSPTEPRLTIVLTVEVPWRIPTSKIEKILRRKHEFRTRLIRENTVEAKYTINLMEYGIVLEKLVKAINDLQNEVGEELTMCIEYRIVYRNVECPCSSHVTRLEDRVMCLEKIGDKNVLIYCNKKENYISIKFIQTSIHSYLDPLQIPSSVFIYCAEINRVREYVKTLERDVENVKNWLLVK